MIRIDPLDEDEEAGDGEFFVENVMTANEEAAVREPKNGYFDRFVQKDVPILESRDQLRHSIAHHNLQQRHLIPVRSLRIQVFQRSSKYLKLIWNILYI